MNDLRDQIRAWTDATAAAEASEPVRADQIIDATRFDSERASDRRPKRSPIPPLVAAGIVLVVAAAAVWIAWPQRSEQTTPATAGDESFFRQPGSPILAGLQVEPGSVLVGRPFPDRGSEPTTRSWTVLVKVTGDPRHVFAGYVDQLEAAGLVVAPSTRDPSQLCYSNPDTGNGLPQRIAWSCSAGFVSTGAEPALRQAWIELVSPRTGADDFPTSLQLDLTLRRPGVPVTTTTLSDAARFLESLPPPSTVTPTPPIPTAPPAAPASAGPVRLPITGESIAPTWMDPGVDLHVVEGSQLLAAPAPLDGGSLGWVTVARLTEDPEQVMREYLHQGNELPIHERKAMVDDRQVYWGWWDMAGGPKVELTAMESGSGNWLLRINMVND